MLSLAFQRDFREVIVQLSSLESWDLDSIQKADTVITSSGLGVGFGGGWASWQALQGLYVITASTLHVLSNYRSCSPSSHFIYHNQCLMVLPDLVHRLRWSMIICWLISLLYQCFFNLWLAFDFRNTEMDSRH